MRALLVLLLAIPSYAMPSSQAIAAVPTPGPTSARVFPADNPDAAPRAVAWEYCPVRGFPTSRVYLPNITKTLGGPMGWDTPFYIQNVGSSPADITVIFYRFSDGGEVTCRTVRNVSPAEVIEDDPNADVDLPDNTQFAVLVTSIGAPITAIVNQMQGSGATTQALSYSGFTNGATTVYLPNVTRRFYGYDVPFIVQNMGPSLATVTASFVSFDGTQHFTTTLSMGAGRSGVVDPDYTEGLTDGTQYAVTLISTQPVGVVVNAHNEALGPVAFSHNGLSGGGTTLYAPYAAKAGPAGIFSPIVVQNVGTASVDATLSFVQLNSGGAPQTFKLTAIQPGGSRAFDPRFTLGTSTPCTTASATCLASGEYSLTITAATPVAAVVLPNSNSTAAGYLANAAPDRWSYVPIVQRNFGGAAGWNGVLYVQSATATSAMLTFRRVPDYDIDATQFITLSPGVTKKIEPRTVVGLRDNAKYSVVATSSDGALLAIAFEQAGTGGDASMIYEGISAPAPQGPFVRGTVTGPSGAVAGVPVYATVGGVIVNSVATDATGQYAFAVNAGSTVGVRFDPLPSTRLASQYYQGSLSLSESTPVSVGTQDKTEINASLVSGVVISGRVVNALGVPIVDAVAFAHRSSCGSCGTILGGHTDASGTFRVVAPAGTYRIHVNPPDGASYLDAWYPRATSFATAADVVANADVANLAVTLSSALRITGTVRDAYGKGIPGIGVRVRQGGGATCCTTYDTATTDVAGMYVAVVPAGTYRVSFVPPGTSGLATAWYAGTSFMDARDIPVAADVSAIDATLSAGRIVMGRTFYNGQQVIGITVQVYLANAPCCDNLVLTTASDLYGEYAAGLAPGTYKIRFSYTSGSTTASKWWMNATTFAAATVVNTESLGLIDGNLP